MSDKTPTDASKVHIQIDDDVANGVYSNLAMVNHTETEFTFDFIYVQPQQPRAKVRARIITNAKHTKRILIALTENIARYEQRFGVIDVATTPGEPEYH